jgi:catechol 2,3-dioxygenase-like lactoylglutathione lyase family enzyme
VIPFKLHTEIIMYDHIGLRVADLDTSLKFYQAALAPLGHVVGSKDQSYAGLGPQDAPALWLHLVKARPGSGAHVAFRATSRAAVDGFHAAGLKAGGRDNGAPGPRADYGPTYYAAFLVDPDGNNVEAVCLA